MSDTAHAHGSPSGPRRAPPPRPRSRRRTLLAIVIVILIAIVIGFVLSRCAARGARGFSGRPTTTVGIAKASLGDVPIRLDALGTVTPEATDQITPRVSGMLIKVLFQQGQRVVRGQDLAEIDPRPFQAALDQAKGQLARDQASLADAKLDLGRYRTLLAQNSIARQTVDTQAALVKQDGATVASDKANVETAALNLSFCHIVAPVAGRVGLRQVDPGNQIVANSATPITVLTQIDPIDVEFTVPEDAIAEIVKNGSGLGGGGLSVTAYDRTGGAALAQGTLLTLDNQIDTTTGTVKGRARFTNPSGTLFPNQFVNVSLLVETLKNQVIVPTTAVRHGPQGDYVWLLETGQTVHAQPVTVGPATSENVSILTGLQAGQSVITEGGDRLREGGRVVLPGQRPTYGGRGGRRGRGRGGHGGHRRGGGGGYGGGGRGGNGSGP
ncbi:MAG: efflux RND transporter periplasmic adaptor subunit [Caulobacteraceae bacterium]